MMLKMFKGLLWTEGGSSVLDRNCSNSRMWRWVCDNLGLLEDLENQAQSTSGGPKIQNDGVSR